MATLELYQKFADESEANDVKELLARNGIQSGIYEFTPFDMPGILFTGVVKEFHLKLESQDFARADEIFEEEAGKVDLSELKGHYLMDFTDEELKDVLKSWDEWSQFDKVLAKRLLKERGIR